MSEPLDVGMTAVQTVHATPTKLTGKESTRFQRFKQFFLPRLRKQEELALAYEEAVVRKTEAESEKLVEEAAKLAAEADVAKQQELAAFCENVDTIFMTTGRPEAAMLKLAKLLETNPEIAAQLDKVNAIMGRLAQTKNCQITFKSSDED